MMTRGWTRQVKREECSADQRRRGLSRLEPAGRQAVAVARRAQRRTILHSCKVQWLDESETVERY